MTSGSITEFGTERTIEQRANMQQVIDWLAKGAPHTVLKDGSTLKGFNYTSYIRIADEDAAAGVDATTGQCGTVGCIAGAAVQFDEPVILDASGYPPTLFFTDEKALDLLGLSIYEGKLLFYPFELTEGNIRHIHASYDLGYWGAELDIGFDEDVLEQVDRDGDGLDDVYPLAQLEFAEPRQIARVLQHFQDTGVIDWYILQS